MPHVLLNVTEDEEEAVYQGGNFDSGNVVGCAIYRIMIFLCNIEDENEEVLNRYGDDNNSDDTDSEIISGMQPRDLL